MKKKLAVLCMAIAAAMSLAGCGSFVCDGCGEEKSGLKHIATIADEKVTLCDDCYKEIKELQDAILNDM